MSIMNYQEAIEAVLLNELEQREDLIILRPGARRVLEESPKEIALPRLGGTSFSVALGAYLTGMHPVLDLRQENDPLSLLIDALLDMPSVPAPDMTILLDAEAADDLLEFPDLRVFCPKTPRQAAGLLRAALRGNGLVAVITDAALSELTDDVPDDPDFMLLPLDDVPAEDDTDSSGEGTSASDLSASDAPASDLPLSDESAPEADAPAFPEASDEESFFVEEPDFSSLFEETDDADEFPELDQGFSENFHASDSLPFTPEPEAPSFDEAFSENLPTSSHFCRAMRQVPCDLSALNALTQALSAPEGWLVQRCMNHLAGPCPFSWQHDASALPGECAFLPPEHNEAAVLWLGCDVLSITYDADCLPHARAAALLRAAKRLLEMPTLLIYDKERDLP